MASPKLKHTYLLASPIIPDMSKRVRGSITDGELPHQIWQVKIYENGSCKVVKMTGDMIDKYWEAVLDCD